jgi:hypothetical protein
MAALPFCLRGSFGARVLGLLENLVKGSKVGDSL